MRAIHTHAPPPHHLRMDHRNALGAAIRYYRKKRGFGQEELSEATSIDQGAISRIENGRQGVTDTQLWALSIALGVHPSEIWAAVDAPTIREPQAPYYEPEFRPRQVPLLGWVQAGEWTDQNIEHAHIEPTEYIFTTARVSSRAFALTVAGESMVNPRGEPSFPPGEKIIVEPEMAATSGSLVVAQIDGEPETTFKKLIIDGGQHLLVPLNPQYVTIKITQATRICGVVISRAEKPLIS